VPQKWKTKIQTKNRVIKMDYVTVKDKDYKVKKGILVLKNKQISSISEIKGLENLHDLRALDLSNNSISEIKGLENLHALRALDLSNNIISEISDLDHLENIFNLNLSNNKISEIKGLDKIKNLRFLRLSNNLIHEIKGLDSQKSLMTLYLNGNKIEEIKGLDNLNNLNALYLAGNNITEVKGIENLHNIKRFDIGTASKLSKDQVQKLKKGGIHTKDQNYFAKRFGKQFMWYCIGITIASIIFSIAYTVITEAPPINFWPTFGISFVLLFIFSPVLYCVGKAYAGY
jgi:uncharacterized membrane protein